MKGIRILELVWDSFNEAHIWERHQLTRADVEEVAYGPAEKLRVQQTYGGRFFVTGPRADKFYLVSARPADRKERREYREWKEGKQK